MDAVKAALFLLFLCSSHLASGSHPKAQNVTWNSINFKTILTWEPKPSPDYSYTVEFSAVGQNRQKNPHCFRSSATTCDLSSSMNNVNACYTADVLSEDPLGVISDIIEPPYTTSPRFCPYKDTDIGKPDFKLEVSADKKITTVYVTDPPTALFKDGRQLTIRDIFTDQLQYRVTYRRNKSTGKKVKTEPHNVIELKDLDKGESYCFNVQAYIPSRPASKQLGELSRTQCTERDKEPFFEMYSVGVIAAAIFLILLLIGIIIAITVVCCKRYNKKSGKEAVPLRDV
ncbi:coagulation factor III, tissue factor a [Echeneis naucrates]|uniref:Tissue factor n=1 Tax=Echeneis naucrates TaxID=173247 RepID=A0A665TBZ2_ECHNA|nr:tissue factor [Echeneis naucrates]